ILLDPARLWMRQRLFAPRLRKRMEVGVVEHRLDGRGALVDPEQQRHAAARARYSAARRHQGSGGAAVGPGSSSCSGPSSTPSNATSPDTRSAIPSDALSPVE